MCSCRFASGVSLCDIRCISAGMCYTASHSTLHTLHSTLHTSHSTLSTPHFALHTPHLHLIMFDSASHYIRFLYVICIRVRWFLFWDRHRLSAQINPVHLFFDLPPLYPCTVISSPTIYHGWWFLLLFLSDISWTCYDYDNMIYEFKYLQIYYKHVYINRKHYAG